VTRFQFVADHRDAFEVKRMCEVIEVNRSSFYAWDAAAPCRAERVAADEELASRIRAVQDPAQGGDKAYGAPRVTAELNDGVPDQERVNHKRVARVMAETGLAGIRLRRKVRTTVPEPSDQKVPDLLKRDFTAETINTKYVGDITYLPLADGSNLYLATVIDCCSRKLAGWAVADHMRTSLVEDALKTALADRGSLRGAIFHADHGSVYTSKDYAKLCGQLGVIRSHGAVGTSADNALAESFNAALKRETLAGYATYGDEASCRREIFRWAVRYNTRRRHSYLGQVSPNTYENKLAATIPEAA
jgi:transposase InsO family protein